MSKLKTVKKILRLLIIMFTIILIGSSVVKASTPSKSSIRMGYKGYNTDGSLYNSTDFYCIQLGNSFNDPETLNKDKTKTFSSDSSSQSERALAYILYHGEKGDWRYNGTKYSSGGYNQYSPYQLAVWKWYQMYGDEDYDGGDPFEYYRGVISEEKLNAGKALWNEANSVAPITYTSASSAKITLSNFWMDGQEGAFNVVELNGKIEKIVVGWKDGSKEVVTKQGDQIKFSNSSNTNIDVNNIGIGNVKVKNKKSTAIESIRVYVQCEASGYQVKRTKWTNTVWGDQDLISVDAILGSKSSADETIEPQYKYALRFIKMDKDTGTPLPQAKFKVYYKADSGREGWIFNYKTDSTGKFQINNVSAGTYYIYEVGASDGYELINQDGYNDVSVPAKQKEYFDDNNVNYVYNGYVKINDSNQVTDRKGLELNTSESSSIIKTFDIKNKKPEGSLTINKTDKTGNNKLDAKFMLYYYNNDEDKGWVVGRTNDRKVMTSMNVATMMVDPADNTSLSCYNSNTEIKYLKRRYILYI